MRATADDLQPAVPAIRAHGTKHGRLGTELVNLAPSACVWVQQAVPWAVKVDVLRDLWNRRLTPFLPRAASVCQVLTARKLMSGFSSTCFEYPLAATRIMARPTFSVVVT